MTPHSESRTGATRRRVALLVLGALASVTLAGCGGSTLDPHDVALANGELGTGSTPILTDEGIRGPAGPETGTPAPAGSLGTGAGVNVPNGTRTVSTGSPATGNGHPGTGGRSPGAGVVAASCAGFRNQTGVSDSVITLANVADLSGPVPGSFTSAQLAAKAYLRYFNSTSSICGRKLALLPLDSRTSASGDEVAWQRACDSAFAGVGSMSAFDSGGAATAQQCGIPDLRAVQTNAARTSCTTCFAAEGSGNDLSDTASSTYWLKNHRDLTQHAAMLYVAEAASVSNAEGEVRAETKIGWRFVYTSKFDVAEFNYSPYVQQMKSKGVKLVQFYGASSMAVRFAQATQAADFHPQLLFNSGVYDATYAAGGPATDGTVIDIDFTPLEDIASNPEMQLYDRWLQQVSPGAKMSYFGLFAWSATRLAVQRMVQLGGRLSRPALIASIRAVHAWTSNGLHTAMDVGGKQPAACWRFVRLNHGVWSDYGGGYTCGKTIRSR